MRKSERSRPYPPDYVDASTLAYRLCCSESLLNDYVRSGILPRPFKIGNLTRWSWASIVEHIERPYERNQSMGEQDACAAAIRKAWQAREKTNGRASS